MSYKIFLEQITEHIKHLQAQGLDIVELSIDSASWVRCQAIGKPDQRGDFAYITLKETLKNGLCGLRTSYRGVNGVGSFKTYGLHPLTNEQNEPITPSYNVSPSTSKALLHEQAAKKAYGFWVNSDTQGESDYLKRKEVGYHGIKFRRNEYGNVAVVPMFDEHGKLWSYQLLNSGGGKRYPKDSRTEGLFHRLGSLVNGKPIGIAESYVTAATVQEITGIQTVCAFSSNNLLAVSKILNSLISASLIILLADNDKHLPVNIGIEAALESINAIGQYGCLALPDFCDYSPSKEATDWNDLARLKGKRAVADQIAQQVPSFT